MLVKVRRSKKSRVVALTLIVVFCTMFFAGCGGGGGSSSSNIQTGRVEGSVQYGTGGLAAAEISGTGGNATGSVTVTVPQGAKLITIQTDETAGASRASGTLRFEVNAPGGADSLASMVNGAPDTSKLAAVTADGQHATDLVNQSLTKALGVNVSDGISETEATTIEQKAGTITSDPLTPEARAAAEAYMEGLPSNSGRLAGSRAEVTPGVLTIVNPTPGTWTVKASSQNRAEGFRASVVVAPHNGIDVGELESVGSRASYEVSSRLGINYDTRGVRNWWTRQHIKNLLSWGFDIFGVWACGAIVTFVASGSGAWWLVPVIWSAVWFVKWYGLPYALDRLDEWMRNRSDSTGTVVLRQSHSVGAIRASTGLHVYSSASSEVLRRPAYVS